MRGIDVSSAPGVFEAGKGRMSASCRPWEATMADVVAHLVSAFSMLEEVTSQHPRPSVAMASYDMASHSVCMALVALDECSSLAWSEPARSDAMTWQDQIQQKSCREVPVTLDCV